MGEPSVEELYDDVRRAIPTAAGEEDHPTPTQVATGIRVLALRTPTLPPAAHTNAYLVGPLHGPQVLVDPGSPWPAQQAQLDAAIEADAAAGRPLALVLLTHHHGDHVGGAAATAARWSVPIAAHDNTAKRLGARIPVSRVVGDGEVVDAGGVAMTAVYTPGHADGHLCFEVSGAAATIAGDMVASIGTILVDPSEGDMGLYLASLERLLARPAATLLPAHGAPITDGPGKLREYLAHRRMREDRILAALRHAATMDALVASVYAETPRALWPLAARSLRAHLDKLVHEGRVRLDGDNWVRLL